MTRGRPHTGDVQVVTPGRELPCRNRGAHEGGFAWDPAAAGPATEPALRRTHLDAVNQARLVGRLQIALAIKAQTKARRSCRGRPGFAGETFDLGQFRCLVQAPVLLQERADLFGSASRCIEIRVQTRVLITFKAILQLWRPVTLSLATSSTSAIGIWRQVTGFGALLDANILYPAPMRDIFLQLAVEDHIRAKWTADIHGEWINALRDEGSFVDHAGASLLRREGRSLGPERNAARVWPGWQATTTTTSAPRRCSCRFRSHARRWENAGSAHRR